MKGKVVLITGATSGIGREIALQLGAMGADLVLACRDAERGEKTADQIRRRPGAGGVEVMLVDTSSQGSVRALARSFRAAHPHLEALVNNAGMNRGAQPRALSVDGIELTFATNVLGYFLLTSELLELLRASEPARIVNVASQFAGDVDLDDLGFVRRPFDSAKAYAQSKACNRMLTWALARRLRGSGVAANAMAPGLVPETGLYRNAPPELLANLRRRSARTSAQGADTAAWLASSPEVEGVSGELFADRARAPCEFRGPEAEEKLWRICERMVGLA